MAYRETDGYIIVDMKGIDVSKASQSVPGLYEKVEPVLDANKLVIVNNAGNHTPLPGSCIKSSNYIRITTDIYIFTINSNNILIIEANGSSITVDVSIIPAYAEGTKIADFEINGQSGELFIPSYPDIINDSVASDHTVYSSDKVNTLLSSKADSSAIPTKTSDLDNDSGFITSSDIPAIPDDLNDLDDVAISSAEDAQVLTFDAISGKWVNATSPSGVTALSQLSDVTISSAADGNVLKYDGSTSKWVNEDESAEDVSYDNQATGLTATNVQAAIDELKGDIPVDIEDLNNVTLTTSDNNKLLGVIVENGELVVRAVDKPFKIDTFTSSNYSITANGTAHMAIDFITVPSGYTLAGIVGFATNQAAVGVSVMRLTTSGSWALQLFNTSSSALSGQPFEVTVLFIKSSLL
jgi:hypothetical protein